MRWTKNIEAIQKRNRMSQKIDMEALKKDIESYPDAYQYERAERLNVSKSAIWYALKRLKVTYKKKHYSIPRQTQKSALYFAKKLRNLRQVEEPWLT